MRTLSELYKLVLKTAKQNGQRNEPQATIVWLCFNRYITGDEHQKILIHYRKNKPTPTLHPEFYSHIYFNKRKDKQDWWVYQCRETRQQQRLFLMKMARITRNRK